MGTNLGRALIYVDYPPGGVPVLVGLGKAA